MKKKIIKKKFGKDFISLGGALTLGVGEVSEDINFVAEGECTRKHKDGWVITGKVQEDYYAWVNDFEAKHKRYGKVWGNFEDVVYATSEKAFEHFYKGHPPEDWDYQDI